MNKYLKLLAFSAVVLAIHFSVTHSAFGPLLHPTGVTMIIFYVVQSFLLLWTEGVFVKNNSQNFVLFTIGSISFRLITSLLVAIVYLVAVGDQNTSFIIHFFTLYLLFLGFELFMLMTNLRTNSKSAQIDE